MSKIFTIMLLCFTAQGCSSTQLTVAGQQIEILTSLDRKDCKNLGPVFGKGGNYFYGGMIGDKSLMKRASVDMRNQAAGMGATHVVILPHSAGNSGGTTSTITQQGIAYSCPK